MRSADLFKPGYRPQNGGFSAAGGTQQTGQFPSVQREGKAV
jgi:hypothetical protein